MHSIVILGRDEEFLATLAKNLERGGYPATVRSPVAGSLDSQDLGESDVLMVDLASIGERLDLSQLIGNAQGHALARIIIVPRQDLVDLDLTSGLDEFLVRTAHPEEVTARVRHALWRTARIDRRDIIRCGDLEIDLRNYTVSVGNRPVGLTYKEYELLRFLAANPDRVHKRETLLNKVWGYEFYGGARTVDVHVRRLRSKIEDRNRAFIETVRNVGYRFRVS